MIEIATYKKGQKISGLKTKQNLEKKLKDVRKTRLAYVGGIPGAYTVTVGAAKKVAPVRKKAPAKRKPVKRMSVKRKVAKKRPAKKKKVVRKKKPAKKKAKKR